MSSPYNVHDAEFRDRVYRPLRRAVDDASANFQKIRNHRLRLKHEIAKQQLERLAAPPDNFTSKSDCRAQAASKISP